MGIKVCYCDENSSKNNSKIKANKPKQNQITNNDNLTNIENIDVSQTQTPSHSGKKDNNNKEGHDNTNLNGDKTDLGESHTKIIINNEQPANSNDNDNIKKREDTNNRKEENGTENKNRIEPSKFNNLRDIQGLFNNNSNNELVQSTSGTLFINSKTNIFEKNKSLYYYSKNNNINNFQGKISSNQYADGYLPQINEQEERN